MSRIKETPVWEMCKRCHKGGWCISVVEFVENLGQRSERLCEKCRGEK